MSRPNAGQPTAANLQLECKKLCVRRCFYAVLYSVIAQFALLATFLLFVHFSPFHPLQWLWSTVGSFASWRTWLGVIPLLLAVIAHGTLLGRAQLAERVHHANRYALLTRTAGLRALLFAGHATIGLLTAWLYAGYLPTAYAHLYAECAADAQRYCLNERYALLLLAGTYTAIYYFVRERVRRPLRFVAFPLVQQARYLDMRSNVNVILCSAFRAALLPIGAFALAAYAFGGLLLANLAAICGLAQNAPAIRAVQMFDGPQLLFAYVIGAQILGNMRLMDHLFGTLLTEHTPFAIERNGPPDGDAAIALADALGARKTPLVQELAALDLAALCSESGSARRRRQLVYALSVPGGHPYNWTALCGQCLALLDAFRDELRRCVEQASEQGKTTAAGVAGRLLPAGGAFGLRAGGAFGARSLIGAPVVPGNGESASDAAAKLLHRQYNETYGIRNMVPTSPPPVDKPKPSDADALCQEKNAKKFDPCRRFNEAVDGLTAKWTQFKAAVLRLPGIYYMFGVDGNARLAHHLTANCQMLVDTIEGLTGLAVHSLREDRYGVVQADLARIVRALLQLRDELEKAVGVQFAGGSAEETPGANAAHRSCACLRGTVRRQLGQLACVFGEYLPDLLDDRREIQAMELFAQFRQT